MNMDLTQEIKRNAYDLAYLKGLISNENTETSWAAIFPANPMRVYKKAPRPYSRYLVNRLGQIKGPLGKVLKPYVNNGGYSVLPVTKDDGKSTAITVSRLAALTFIPNPDRLSDVDHIDDNRLNNALYNLQWVSHRDNLNKAHRRQLMKAANGRPIKKLNDDGSCVLYNSIKEAAEANHLSNTSVSGSASGQLHLNKPYHFIFAK